MLSNAVLLITSLLAITSRNPKGTSYRLGHDSWSRESTVERYERVLVGSYADCFRGKLDVVKSADPQIIYALFCIVKEARLNILGNPWMRTLKAAVCFNDDEVRNEAGKLSLFTKEVIHYLDVFNVGPKIVDVNVMADPAPVFVETQAVFA
ncbi:hypothetical protein GNI_207820 [Gregarina niphandrodes]|uniref:Transmembrane protein n=1 Tax=Gregarina niphandrodes TaxID=110365 RepID=A0A023AWH7_GRENI|nr:hypothetical protein GNI_207820 [Gregarina niphandrodes]EZG42917.1 hypothetical protein GNI_207820 [Gregarina niphandrodes]|eukprot:XP_011133807.1 hypothetical protein GNI_207820 [Gregarina niphandrodes]